MDNPAFKYMTDAEIQTYKEIGQQATEYFADMSDTLVERIEATGVPPNIAVPAIVRAHAMQAIGLLADSLGDDTPDDVVQEAIKDLVRDFITDATYLIPKIVAERRAEVADLSPERTLQ